MEETDITSERVDFYGFLMEFTGRVKHPCREHLTKRDKERFERALEKGYIVPYGKNSEGDQTYAITELGKEIRDK